MQDCTSTSTGGRWLSRGKAVGGPVRLSIAVREAHAGLGKPPPCGGAADPGGAWSPLRHPTVNSKENRSFSETGSGERSGSEPPSLQDPPSRRPDGFHMVRQCISTPRSAD